jgi:hypothetical protein
MNTHSLDLEKDSSQYAEADDSASLDIVGDISFEAWVKLESLPSANGASMNIMGKADHSITEYSYLFYIYSDDKLVIYFWSGGNSNTFVSASAIVTEDDLGHWIHLAATLDISESDGCKIYKDGSPVSVGAKSGTDTSINNTSAKFRIGTYKGVGQYFDGLIDEARLWNDVRTPTEISDNKSIELDGDEAGLAAYFKLNNSYLDETANNNDLTAVNSPVFSEDVPFSGAAARTDRMLQMF